MAKNSLEASRAHARAYQRARQRLVEEHRQEFGAYLEEEKAKEGIKTLTSRQIIEEARRELSA